MNRIVFVAVCFFLLGCSKSQVRVITAPRVLNYFDFPNGVVSVNDSTYTLIPDQCNAINQNQVTNITCPAFFVSEEKEIIDVIIQGQVYCAIPYNLTRGYNSVLFPDGSIKEDFIYTLESRFEREGKEIYFKVRYIL